MSAKVPEMGNRGSEWHRWEPHIHAPGTVLEDRYPKKDGWERYLKAIETASPPIRAIGITDYCITRSYELVKAARDEGRLTGCKLVFPNIELRLDIGTRKGNFVNIHLLVCPEDPNHVAELNRFLGELKFQAHEDRFACTQSELIRLGQKSDSTKTDEEAALRYGCTQFKVSRENLVAAHRDMEWARQNIIIAVAGAADGTSGVKEAADATLRQEIEKTAHAIFASSPKQREFWLGRGSVSVSELRERYNGQKPCLSGSDAHDLSRVGRPEEDRLCWIKGMPAFDALRQACIDPERAYIGPSPPSSLAASQIIDEVHVEGAPWLKTPNLKLNEGLVAIIGARGTGKTALADMIAAGCGSYEEYEESEERPSFLARAREHLSGSRVSLKWLSARDVRACPLDSPISVSTDSYQRARYLSQQFVEKLCSTEGMPTLIKEIERVIFEAHSSTERSGTVDFDELLELRARRHRDARAREEDALANLSDQIGIEMEKSRQVKKLKAQISEKEKMILDYRNDHKNLLPKKTNKNGKRLQDLVTAAEKVRIRLRHLAKQQDSLSEMKSEVQDLRQNRAPKALRSMKDRYQSIKLEAADWDLFLLNYSGDVDAVVAKEAKEAEKHTRSLKGKTPTKPTDASSAFRAGTEDLSKIPLATLEAEIERLEPLVAADKETARKLSAVSKRIVAETTTLERLKEKLADYEVANKRAQGLVADREQGYLRVFEAMLSEERVLNELYAPLMRRLETADGTLAKLSFTVTRTADVVKWAKQGEDELFDLRGGPFKGIGSLAKEANSMLVEAWTTGNAAAVSAAMAEFRQKHQEALLEKAPYPRTDLSGYRSWTRCFAKWLYSTDHISIEYGIQYDGIDIRKLSPGTRGVVMVLLYLALDDADDRPLIIDQPEENLDPKSIHDELVPLFQKTKRKRQVIMVTHNANLVINADADQIIIAQVGARTVAGLPPIEYRAGGLDEAPIRKIVCDTLEGGEHAFRERARRLRILFDR